MILPSTQALQWLLVAYKGLSSLVHIAYKALAPTYLLQKNPSMLPIYHWVLNALGIPPLHITPHYFLSLCLQSADPVAISFFLRLAVSSFKTHNLKEVFPNPLC